MKMIKPFRNKLNILSPKFYDRIWFFNELALESDISKNKYYALSSLLTLDKTDIILDLEPRDYVRESIELTFNVTKILGEDPALFLIKELNTFHDGVDKLEWMEKDILSFLPRINEHKLRQFLWSFKVNDDSWDSLTVKEFLEIKNVIKDNEDLTRYLLNKYIESLITVLTLTRPVSFKFEVGTSIKVYLDYYEGLTFEEIKKIENKKNSLGYLEELVLLLYDKGELLLSTLQTFELNSGYAYTFETYEQAEEYVYKHYKGYPELKHGFVFNKCTENTKLRLFENIARIKSGEPTVETDIFAEFYVNNKEINNPYSKYFTPLLSLGTGYWNSGEMKEKEEITDLDSILYNFETYLEKCSKTKDKLKNTNLPEIFRGRTEFIPEDAEKGLLQTYLNHHTTKLAEDSYFTLEADFIQTYPTLLEKSKILREEVIDEILTIIDHFSNKLQLKEPYYLDYLKEFYVKNIEKHLNFSKDEPWEYGNFWEEVAKRLIARTDEVKEGFTGMVLENLVDKLLDQVELNVKCSELLCNGGDDEVNSEEITRPEYNYKLNYLLADTDEKFFENIFLKNIIKGYYSKEIYELLDNFYSKEAYNSEEFSEVIEDLTSSLIKTGYSIPSADFLRRHFEDDFGIILAYIHETYFSALTPFLTEFYESTVGKCDKLQEKLVQNYGEIQIRKHWSNLYKELEKIVEGEDNEQ